MEIASLSKKNKVLRFVWNITYVFLFRYTPSSLFFWRSFILRLFGAQIGRGVHVYPKVKIWAPWNLKMEDGTCLANYVDCYSVGKITIRLRSTVSQYSYLCTASHDYTSMDMPLLVAPIVIEQDVWITSDVFIGPGVTIKKGAVILARSSVFSDMPAWYVAKGNPAKPFKRRKLGGVNE